MKEKNYKVKNFAELKRLVDNTNPYVETLVLIGFVRDVKKKDNTIKLETKKLIFKKISLDVLRNDEAKKR